MSKRLLILTCAAALISGACSKLLEANVNLGNGKEFVPYVADHLDDAGLGNAVALDKDGIPYVSYFIFPGVVEPGAIPVPRPIGAPFITTGGDDPKDGAAVGIASMSADGVWTRGAAAEVPLSVPHAGIVIPYDPDDLDGLVGATAENTNGTDIAVDATGGKHVVWAGRDGIWYATGTTSFKGSATSIEEWTPPLSHSGPLGRPSVTVDDSAQPWVAYAIDTVKGQDIRVATTDGTAWTTQTAATVDRCPSCRLSGPAPIAVNADGPLVVYVDGGAGAVMAARKSGSSWTTETVQAGVSPSGLSVAVDANGTPWVTYYTGDGAVNLATSSGAAWTTVKVADANPGDRSGSLAETTGVAVDDNGTVYVAYEDDKKGVHLTSGAHGRSFESIDTEGTEGGGFPSLAMTQDGSRVFLAWYDMETQNLLLGVLGDVTDILIARPSPTSEPPSEPSPTPPVTCPKGGLELVAPSGAAASGFAETTLSAPANTDFSICFNNQDSGVQHNVDAFDKAPPNSTSIAAGNIITGPAQELLDVPGQPAGTYYYACDVHPTTMNGTLTIT